VNPRDIVADAVYNFHPQYQQYTRHDAAPRRDDVDAYYRHSTATENPDVLSGGSSGNSADGRYQDQTLVAPATSLGFSANGEASAASSASAGVNAQLAGAAQAGDSVATVMPGLSRTKLNEKAVLLPTNDVV